MRTPPAAAGTVLHGCARAGIDCAYIGRVVAPAAGVTLVRAGRTVRIDLGDDELTIFLGDQIYDHHHCYLADGFYKAWLANIEQLRARFPDEAVFHVGHGGPVGQEMWDWQLSYIELFVDAGSGVDWTRPEAAKPAVVARMKEYEPSDDLQFLMELSIEPLAAREGLLSPSA